MLLIHWPAIRPTPPAAAWNNTLWLASNLKLSSTRYLTVNPFKIADAAMSYEILSGIETTKFSLITLCVE